MLNENLEYEIYASIDNKSSSATSPIPDSVILNMFKNEKDNGSGLGRILEILARGMLSQPEEKIKKRLDDWLYAFENSDIIKANVENDEKAIKFRKRIVSAKKSNGNKSLFSVNSFSNQNDYNVIRFDGIIADAKNKGELKEYWLLAKEDLLSKNPAKNTPAVGKYSDTKKKYNSLEKGQQDYLLKLTATYLINELETGVTFPHVVKIDVTNWSVSKNEVKNMEYYYIDSPDMPPQQLIYDTISISKDSKQTRSIFDKRWLDNFKIVEAGASIDSEYHYKYLDNGLKQPLKKEKI